MKIPALVASVMAPLLLVPDAAEAALKKYELRVKVIVHAIAGSPNPIVGRLMTVHPGSVVRATDDGGGHPRLTKLLFHEDTSGTSSFDSGFVYFSQNQKQGPVGTFTGTGSTVASTLAWGSVTGWTVTGSLWCNSEPPVLCTLARATDDTTVEPRFTSDFFDLGTWTFHTTGFVATPFINDYNTTDFGNVLHIYIGRQIFDATVPALPLVGVTLLGGGLVLAGMHLVRRRPR